MIAFFAMFYGAYEREKSMSRISVWKLVALWTAFLPALACVYMPFHALSVSYFGSSMFHDGIGVDAPIEYSWEALADPPTAGSVSAFALARDEQGRVVLHLGGEQGGVSSHLADALTWRQ